MTVLWSLLAQILHILLVLLAAPTVAGVLHRVGAMLSGRAGASVMTPWRDLARLCRKTAMEQETTTSVGRFAPAVSLAATAVCACLVPSFALGMTMSPMADVVTVVSLLMLARVALALAVFDAGAALPGLGQQEASASAVIAEPALMLAVVALGVMAGTFDIDGIAAQQRDGVLLPATSSAVAFAAMLALFLAAPEDSRAETVFGGTDLAMVLVSGWLRRLVWIGLIGTLFLPVGIATAGTNPLAWLLGLAVWALKVCLGVMGLILVRHMAGRLSRRARPELVTVAALLALLAVAMALANAGAA